MIRHDTSDKWVIQLKDAMRPISGVINLIPLPWVPVLVHSSRMAVAVMTPRMYKKSYSIWQEWRWIVKLATILVTTTTTTLPRIWRWKRSLEITWISARTSLVLNIFKIFCKQYQIGLTCLGTIFWTYFKLMFTYLVNGDIILRLCFVYHIHTKSSI